MDLLVISNEPPYSTSNAIDSLDAALAATNIGLKVGYLFKGEGVYQLTNQQQPDGILHKSTSKRLAVLPLFDIHAVYVCKKSAKKFDVTLDHIDFEYKLVDEEEILHMVQHTNSVLNF